jgi:hypothetical protein
VNTEPNDELSRLREDVFREIGRNVVMFQDIERILKIILNRGRFVATASQLAAWQAKAPAPYAKRMLGELIEPLMERHFVSGEPGDQTLPENKEITVGFEFHVNLSDGDREVFQQRLESMVKQRNELIHHLLDWLRLDTAENCQVAISRLQLQREETEPIHRNITAILKVFFETSKDAAKYLKENGLKENAS